MKRLLQVNALLPVRYELSFLITSLRVPQTLLIETVTLRRFNNSNNNSDFTPVEPDASILRLHCGSKCVKILDVIGATVISPSTETPDPQFQQQDVTTFKLDSNNVPDAATPSAEATIHLLLDVTAVDGLVGLYRAKFAPDDKTPHSYCWGTHNEPIGARQCFAAVDEPNARADFTLAHYLLSDVKENATLRCVTGAPKEGGDEDAPAPIVALRDSLFSSKNKNNKYNTVFTDKQWTIIDNWLKKNGAAAIEIQDQQNNNQQQQQTHKEFSIATTTFHQHQFQVLKGVPSYLVAMTIGDLDFVEPTGEGEGGHYTSPGPDGGKPRTVPMRLYFHRGRDRALARYPIKVLRFALEFFEKFFNCPYPWPKLDSVALCSFAIGGMENVGLIFLVERVMLDPKSTPSARLESLTNLLCHEVSHMWFGNAVGIAEWTGLWLKEGMASFFGAYAAEQFLGYEGALNNVELFDALDVSAYEAAHECDLQVDCPDHKAVEVFDSLSYNQGQAVVQMLRTYLGHERFRDALAFYINKYQFQNTTSAQLWNTLGERTGEPIGDLMRSFTVLKGHPVVSVSFSDDTKKQLKVTQKKFILPGDRDEDGKNNSSLWTIPVNIGLYSQKTNKTTIIKALIRERETTIPLLAQQQQQQQEEGGGDITAVIFNVDHAGFFRTDYTDDAMFDSLLNHSAACLNEKFLEGLLDDAWALWRCSGSSSSPTRNYLKLIKFLGSSSGNGIDCRKFPDVFSRAAGLLPGFCKTYFDALTASAVPGHATSLVMLCYRPFVVAAQQLGKSSVAGEDPRIAQLRPVIWSALAGAYELLQKHDWPQRFPMNEFVIDVARRLFPQLLSDSIALGQSIAKGETTTLAGGDTNMLPLQLRLAVRWGGTEIYDAFWTIVKRDPDSAIAREVVYALAATPDLERYTALAHEVFTGDVIRSQLGHTMTAHLRANNELAGTHLWSLFKKDIKTIIDRWGNGTFRIQSIVQSVANTVSVKDNNNNNAAAEEYRQFFVVNPIPIADMSIRRAAQSIEVRAALAAPGKADELAKLL